MIELNPIVVARKPLSENTVVDNVQKWRTGGINIDESRINISPNDDIFAKNPHTKGGFGHENAKIYGTSNGSDDYDISKGRFPANLIIDEDAGRMLDEQSGISRSGVVKNDKGAYGGTSNTGFLRGVSNKSNQHGDIGGASRFFKTIKNDESMDGSINMDNVKLLLGDCLDKLKELEDNSVDSIVTDPPYGLSFMGKQWDYDVPSVEIWEECLRVLKPGGHLLAFAGSRTYHRMAVRIEDAGFEIRDMISWLYGCLSEDTEIFTKDGWIPYHKIKECDTYIKDDILIYDVNTDTYLWETPEKWNEYYVNNDTTYRIKSDTTDQLVSRNHRCIIERNGKLIFKLAETLEQQENIPILEGMPVLPLPISNIKSDTGKTKQILQFRLCKQNDRDVKPGEIKKGWYPEEESEFIYNDNLQCLWEAGGTENKINYKISDELLQLRMQRKGEGRGVEKMGRGGCSNSQLTRKQKAKSQLRRKEWGLEGWNNSQTKKRILLQCKDKICEVSHRIQKYVKKRWLCDRISVEYGNGIRKAIESVGVRTSYRPQPGKQHNNEFDVIQEQLRPQEIRSGASYRTTVATISEEQYTGIIFCPTVSTGAFVARRNGMVFITGNSGFPKSMDISKQFDKRAGVEREVVGKRTDAFGDVTESETGDGRNLWGKASTTEVDVYSTEAVSDLAKEWSGWGTALKPAHEPVVMARKPLSEGTVVDNVQKWRTGGINIDESRIGNEPLEYRTTSYKEAMSGEFAGQGQENITTGHKTVEGRFPANIIIDEEAGKLLDEQSGTTKSVGGRSGNKEGIGQNGIYGDYKGIVTDKNPGFGDIGGASRFFYCPKVSKSERNEGLGAFPDLQGNVVANSSGRPYKLYCQTCGKRQGICKCEPSNFGYENPNTTKNIHPTVKPVDLMLYLIRLVTPKGGTTLDPFMGSGSTGKAAVRGGFGFIGIEREGEYYEIAEARINYEADKPKVVKNTTGKKVEVSKETEQTLNTFFE
jgi:site-specific DNA-methyltransferase (adenine-specific)